jgi:hypothetical protein
MLKLCTERKKALKYLYVQRPTIPLLLISWDAKIAKIENEAD